MGGQTGPAVAAGGAAGRGMRVTHSYRQRIAAPPAQVLPLLCPVLEAEWLEGWQYDMVYSASGVAEKGCVFTTAGDDRQPEVVWIITRHDPDAGIVEMVRVAAGLLVVALQVTLTDNEDGTTAAQVTYTFTALSAAGAELMSSQHCEAKFLEMVTVWEQSMNRYLGRH